MMPTIILYFWIILLVNYKFERCPLCNNSPYNVFFITIYNFLVGNLVCGSSNAFFVFSEESIVNIYESSQ